MTRQPKGRKALDLRPTTIETHVNLYAEGSALIKMGNTHVLCTASVEEKVPEWMKGKGRGWVTSEYSMLPRATHTRTKRDREKISGRTQEIQRLIGRALRNVVDLQNLGERTVHIDCDVLQADGGTRTASINGGCVALILALEKLLKEKKITTRAWNDTVAAISIGIKDQTILTDVDYSEDSTCDVDSNFVVTGKGALVEIQGTAEKNPFSKENLQTMLDAAFKATHELKAIQLSALQLT